MEHNRSWEPDIILANLETIRILWNLNIYYDVDKNQPSFPDVSQMNSVPLILLGKIHCINPFAVGSSKLSLPCIFYTHAVCFANFTLLDFITLIFGEKYKL